MSIGNPITATRVGVGINKNVLHCSEGNLRWGEQDENGKRQTGGEICVRFYFHSKYFDLH